MSPKYSVTAANRKNWDDLLELFGRSGAYWGCWCMYWRFSSKEFNQTKSDNHKISLQVLVDQQDYVPGMLAYKDQRPVGWIGFGPRSKLERLNRSRVISKFDEQEVLSVICFFIHKKHRNAGVATSLLNRTIDYAKRNNFPAIEAYPINLEAEVDIDPTHAFMGITSLFSKFGFEEVSKTKSTAGGRQRVVMRLNLS
ncbi:MAG: GNAT family N-acetyltransferase [Candidatus Heimdallarchaeota archaeon]|nr:GNAT family N-acetyltransferase [Candidatus Heimdallarchaeota archaeon]